MKIESDLSFFTLDSQYKIAYKLIEIGNAKNTIVLLHDSLGCIELWRSFPEQLALACQMNVLVYDRLGYGVSDPMPTSSRDLYYMHKEAEVLYKLLVELNLKKTILIGHSDGGSIALIAASKYQTTFQSVISIAGHVIVEEETIGGILSAKKAYAETSLPIKLAKYHSDKTSTLFAAWVDTWTQPFFKSWHLLNELTLIKCPVLWIQGEQDEYGTIQQINATAAQLSGYFEYHILPNLSHTPQKENPELIIRLIKEFINKTEG